jgi:hypothetical protein
MITGQRRVVGDELAAAAAASLQCIGEGKPHRPYEFGVKRTTVTRRGRKIYSLHAPEVPACARPVQRSSHERSRYALVAGRFTPNVADDTAEIGLELIRLRWRA